MNTNKWIIGIVVVLIVAVGAYFIFGSKSATAPQTASVTDQESQETSIDEGVNPAASAPAATQPQPSGNASKNTVTVTLTDAGFSPSSVTIKAGDSVTWVNQSSGAMWVASGMHPSHTVYDGTDRQTHCAPGYSGPVPFDECTAVNSGQSYTFTFNKAGTWQYHNHVNASQFGSLTVQ